MVEALPQKCEKCYFFGFFPSLSIKLEKLGSFPHHLNSPFSIRLTGENRTESLQTDEHYLLFSVDFSTEFKSCDTWYHRTLKSEQLQLTKVQ